jgi:hypothetical protein
VGLNYVKEAGYYQTPNGTARYLLRGSSVPLGWVRLGDEDTAYPRMDESVLANHKRGECPPFGSDLYYRDCAGTVHYDEVVEAAEQRFGSPFMQETDMATVPSNPDHIGLYRVYITDKTVLNDDDATKAYYVRAETAEQAKMRAILRHGVEDDFFEDYTIVAHLIHYVSKVSDDAE